MSHHVTYLGAVVALHGSGRICGGVGAQMARSESRGGDDDAVVGGCGSALLGRDGTAHPRADAARPEGASSSLVNRIE